MLNQELVRDWMTAAPITIKADTSLFTAHDLMKKHAIRRLPVVNNDHTLIGIVSLSDILEAKPSDATSLTIYELNYLISRLTIDRIMTTKVMTVSPDTTIAQAARIMRDMKIGGIPVLEDERLVGIITESDIFSMIVEMASPLHTASHI